MSREIEVTEKDMQEVSLAIGGTLRIEARVLKGIPKMVSEARATARDVLADTPDDAEAPTTVGQVLEEL